MIGFSRAFKKEKNFSRLLKNAHLPRYPHSASLRRTSMYASFLGFSGALHLDVFDQPAYHVLFTNPIDHKPGWHPRCETDEDQKDPEISS